MDISIPEEIFGIKKWDAVVVRNYNVASLLKNLLLKFQKTWDTKQEVIFKLKYHPVK